MALQPTAFPTAAAAEYRAGGHWRDETIGALFAATCAARGGAVALVDADREISFTAWHALVERAARGLRGLGIAPGDVVAYQLPNWWEAAVLFLAAAKIGAVVNPVLPMFRERELRFILRQSGASLLAIPGRRRDCDHRELLAGLRGELSALREIVVVRDAAPQSMRSWAALLEAGAAAVGASAAPVDPDGVLMLMYTSGTTADPKGVLHSHNTLAAEVRSLARIHALAPADRTLMPSPLTHISGVVHAILTPALLGTSAVLMERWDAATGRALLARHGVTYMVGAPTFLQDLVEPQHADVPRSLRLFSCGGAAVSAELIRTARRVLGCVAKRVYGSTEFPTITTTDAGDAEAMGADTEGRPIAPNLVRIVDADGAPLPADREGEVQARGPERCLGYADAALNADAFTADGWLRSGDLGTLDDAGYLRITGRVKDIVIRKGEKFSVRELEQLIARHPAVADVAVVALPDPRSGERACAVVVARPGAALTLAELNDGLLAAGLTRRKLPEQLELVDALPRTDSGKVHRAALRARFA